MKAHPVYRLSVLALGLGLAAWGCSSSPSAPAIPVSLAGAWDVTATTTAPEFAAGHKAQYVWMLDQVGTRVSGSILAAGVAVGSLSGSFVDGVFEFDIDMFNECPRLAPGSALARRGQLRGSYTQPPRGCLTTVKFTYSYELVASAR